VLKRCPYHVDGADIKEKKKIKKAQTKCGDYPHPNYFLDGYCYHYRPPTGHCDRDIGKLKGDYYAKLFDGPGK
jgi:hypothetical protein